MAKYHTEDLGLLNVYDKDLSVLDQNEIASTVQAARYNYSE